MATGSQAPQKDPPKKMVSGDVDLLPAQGHTGDRGEELGFLCRKEMGMKVTSPPPGRRGHETPRAEPRGLPFSHCHTSKGNEGDEGSGQAQQSCPHWPSGRVPQQRGASQGGP